MSFAKDLQAPEGEADGPKLSAWEGKWEPASACRRVLEHPQAVSPVICGQHELWWAQMSFAKHLQAQGEADGPKLSAWEGKWEPASACRRV